ncbi:hypothetical protein FB451DRAFT_1569191 [Mycena latifolia]|nr:hypothetical protein FB451DRAFT_1569191 [Mycena latifolia]
MRAHAAAAPRALTGLGSPAPRKRRGGRRRRIHAGLELERWARMRAHASPCTPCGPRLSRPCRRRTRTPCATSRSDYGPAPVRCSRDVQGRRAARARVLNEAYKISKHSALQLSKDSIDEAAGAWFAASPALPCAAAADECDCNCAALRTLEGAEGDAEHNTGTTAPTNSE